MHRIKSDSGESLVEVLASLFIFLMMVAIMQGAISFCTNAQHKSEQIREKNTEICQQVWTEPVTNTGTATFEFQAVSADGEQTGMRTLFKVEANLGTKTVSYPDEAGAMQDYTFYVYAPKPAVTGGDTP